MKILAVSTDFNRNTNNRNLISKNNNSNNNQVAFKMEVTRPLRKVGFALLAATLGLSSCNNQQNKNDTENKSTYAAYFIENEDPEIFYGTKTLQDGTKITSIKLDIDKNEYTRLTTTDFPDGSKTIRYDIPERIHPYYYEESFWPNGNKKEEKFCDIWEREFETPEYNPATGGFDGFTIVHEENIEGYYNKYNENGILIAWENRMIEENDGEEAKYDKLGRVVYSEVHDKHYEYHGNTDVVSKFTSSENGCKHIIEYDKDGKETNNYFLAKDGTVTPYSVIENVDW